MCDHIVGEWSGVDEGGTFTQSNSANYGSMCEVRYEFCPLCGVKLDQSPFPKNEEDWSCPTDPIGKALWLESLRFGGVMLSKIATKPSFFDLLENGEFPKESGQTVKVITYERK